MAGVRRLAVLVAVSLGLALTGCAPVAAPARTTGAQSPPSLTPSVTQSGPTSSAGAAPSSAATPDSGLPTVRESRLPTEAQQTLRLVRAGGPYPYRQDDGVFQNRERVLPRQPRGYYREYTVRTPGESDRGPRRLVRGERGDLYWTADHYATFRQVQEGR